MIMVDDSVRGLSRFTGVGATSLEPHTAADHLRKRAGLYLTTLAESDQMPWDGLQQTIAAIMVEQISRVLPDAERDGVRAAFAAEMFRLRTAAAAD